MKSPHPRCVIILILYEAVNSLLLLSTYITSRNIQKANKCLAENFHTVRTRNSFYHRLVF
jgi:hypothetical protein